MSAFGRSRQWKHTLGFTASRDRKLRIWDLGSDACIRVIDLPALLDLPDGEQQRSLATVNSSTNDEGTNNDNVTLFSTPPIIRTYADSDTLFVIVYIPAPLPSGNFVVCYQVHFEGPSFHPSRAGAANIGHIDLLWEKRCDEETMGWNAELRDMVVTTEPNQGWRLWGLWDAAGRTTVKQTDGLNGDQAWSNISGPQSYSPLHGLSLDEDLKAVAKAEDMANFFMRRIVEPGRFSKYSLEGALREYETMLMDQDGMLPNPAATTSASDSIREQVCNLVGCTVELQEDTKTGALLDEAYWTALRREWTTFISLIEDQEAKGRWPIGFVKGKTDSDAPFVVSRGQLSLPVVEDPSSVLLRAVQQKSKNEEGLDIEVVEVLGFASKLSRSIQPAALVAFEVELLRMLEIQSSIPPENIVDVLWTTHLQGAFEDEETLEEEFAMLGSDIKEAILRALEMIRKSTPTDIDDQGPISSTLTELDAALCSDAMTQVSSDRLALARMLSVLLFSLYVGFLPYEESLDGIATIEELVGDAMATYHRLYAFDVLARREGTVEMMDAEPNLDDGRIADASTVAQEMENLQFNSDGKEANEEYATATANNLVHACILRRSLGASLSLSSTSVSRRISHFSVNALEVLLFSRDQALQPIELTLPLALFANEVVKLGYPSASAAFVQVFPRTPASHYLLARSHIMCNEVELAASAFDRVVPAFYRLDEEHSVFRSGLMDMISPAIKRAETTQEALFCYYRRVTSYFQQRASQSPYFVAQFAKKAINASSALPNCDTRALQEIGFNSLLTLEWYEDAYSHLLAIPYLDEQRRLLPDLISRMCEQGHVELLLSLNFASLQLEVVSTLSFKARNSKSLDEIEFYFDLLYAFYVKRGDLKNAGATMWQMGTRLRHTAQSARRLQSGAQIEAESDQEVRNLSIMEARCYLASINVLSQLDIRDAWFAHETGGAEEEEELDSKLTNYVPPSSFYGKSRDTLRIVHLKDIRRRYQIRLAQLELLSTRPQYSTSILTTDRNDANNVISLFASNDDFERAFTLARLLNVDRKHIYTALTDRCLELAHWNESRKGSGGSDQVENEHPLIQALLDDQESVPLGIDEGMDVHGGFLSRIDRCTTWSGSATQRSWRYLRLWLSMEEDQPDEETGIVSKYHLVVLNRILHWHQFPLAPTWLVNWLRSNEVELFIKALLAHDLLEVGLRESLKMIRVTSSSITFPRKRKRQGLSSEVYLPYLLLDELLKRSEEGSASSPQQMTTPPQGTLVERRKLAKEVRDAIEMHKEHLQKVEAQWRRERDEDERRQRRYLERQEEQRDITMS